MPIRRYDDKGPGELIPFGINKPRRFERVGHRIMGDRTGQSNAHRLHWDRAMVRPWSEDQSEGPCLHRRCIDHASRIAVTGICPDEKPVSAIATLRTAVVRYHDLCIKVTHLMTEVSVRSGPWSDGFRGLIGFPNPWQQFGKA